MFVPNFKILGAEVPNFKIQGTVAPEKSLTQIFPIHYIGARDGKKGEKDK